MPENHSLSLSHAPALKGALRMPGDKSISHRSLMLSSLAIGTTIIEGLLESEDVMATASALRELGVPIQQEVRHWKVQGVGIGGYTAPKNILDMGNAGTATRLMMGLLAGYSFPCFMTGDASLRSRPMMRVIKPLSEMGCNFTTTQVDRLPLMMQGRDHMLPLTYRLPMASAQVKSCILLAGLHIAGKTTVIEDIPTRDHTERMLQDFGVDVEQEPHPDGGTAISVHGYPEIIVKDKRISVPGDPSSAAFMMVAALIVPDSELTLHHICMNPTRIGLVHVLQEMGGDITIQNQRTHAGEDVADIHVRYTSALKAVTTKPEIAASMIDEFPIAFVVASCAEGESRFKDLHELRVKESDRLQVMLDGLLACGVDARIDGDDMVVRGGKARGGATIATELDHRIAMSFLVLGMVSEKPIHIDNPACINTSFPTFIPMLEQLGCIFDGKSAPQVHRPIVIAIDGPAASGKGSLARRLASHLGLAYLDTGKLYRAVGLKLVYADHDPRDEEKALEAAQSITPDDLNNPRLRQEKIGNAASIVSAMPEVRAALLEFQRNFAKREGGAVLDGRDIGTVVCPDADVKLFITADLDARAARRHKELQGFGIEVIYESVRDELAQRDNRDQRRQHAPLKPADDAITLDTSALSADEVFDRVLTKV